MEASTSSLNGADAGSASRPRCTVRPIARSTQQIAHELFGAATAQGCTEFMVATNGRVGSAAQTAADTLGVHIRTVAADSAPALVGDRASRPRTALSFDDVWQEVASLAGRTIARANGTANEILSVDGGGVVRRTSGGARQRLEVEIFRWTIERLLAGETVTRAEINERYIKRGSSGIVLILASLPMFEVTKVDGRVALEMSVQSGD